MCGFGCVAFLHHHGDGSRGPLFFLQFRQLNGRCLDASFRRTFGFRCTVEVIEECVELVEFLLADRVVFVVVALSTLDGQPQECRSKCLNSVQYVFVMTFLWQRGALVDDQMKPIEPRRDQLVFGWFRVEITCQLVLDEVIKAQVVVEGTDQPRTVR
jgi:hypothetical protein